MSVRNNYTHTLWASCIGYVVQSIVINFVPLLFVLFNTSYGISYEKISLIITINFFIQLVMDLVCPVFIDKIGYRASVIIADAFAAVGLLLLAFLPFVMSNVYAGIIISLLFTAAGGGLIEVVVSPIVEACPHENKNGYMCLLHSFYCWGHVFVVLVAALYFAVFGIENWRYLSVIFSLIPFLNIFYFLFVPINSLDEVAVKNTGKHSLSFTQLAKNKLFWLMFLLMFCSGACELSVSQWASALAEQGLKVSKTVGDLAGPLSFALLMGSSRVIYSKFGKKLPIEKYMLFCSILCFASYLLISLAPLPILSLVGCALCGWSVGVMWPGTYSMAAKELKRGSTAMFGILALAGDLGCIVGPATVGFASDLCDNNLKIGIFSSIVFSVIMIIGVIICIKRKRESK